MQKFVLTGDDFLSAICQTAAVLEKNRDYVTSLDAATGDGDHWINLNMGYEKLLEQKQELASLPLQKFFKQIAIIMMSTIGGSSGALYGTAFLRVADVVSEEQQLDSQGLYKLFTAMCDGIMERGRSKPGDKTMVDTLYPVVEAYKNGLESGMPVADVLTLVQQAAEQGVEGTRDMEAIRGRAYYQANKGVGHLDPGAVTMMYLITEITKEAAKHIH